MKRAALVGVGLMGGSLGMALRRRGWRVTGVGRSDARLTLAKRLGAIDDAAANLAEGVQEADVVVLAAPVADIAPLALRAARCLKPGAWMTDVGSVKGPIAKALAREAFIGAHPMCGSEKTGVDNAQADLFRGAPCALTPASVASRRLVGAARAFWESVGARVSVMPPAVHDRRVALVSHLPHLLAEALVLVAAADRPALKLAAGSFRDATRVAGADPSLWSQIYALNRPAVRRAARAFSSALRALVAQGPSAAALRRVQKEHARLPR